MSENTNPTLPGNSDDYGGDDPSNPRRNSETAGSDPTSDGNNTSRRSTNREWKGKWAGLAIALATVVYILAELVGIATGNKDRFEDLQRDVNRELPSVGAELDRLQNSLNNLGNEVAGIPTPPPAIPPVVNVAPGKNGKATVIVPPPEKVYITPPATSQSTPKPTPTITPCRIPLGNGCVLP